ncbi:hypothetical protein SNEBB_000045 [Seison nebaliae]|nr:hypothetical protein SNEBB_000045 [Seison nebaliae]
MGLNKSKCTSTTFYDNSVEGRKDQLKMKTDESALPSHSSKMSVDSGFDDQLTTNSTSQQALPNYQELRKFYIEKYIPKQTRNIYLNTTTENKRRNQLDKYKHQRNIRVVPIKKKESLPTKYPSMNKESTKLSYKSTTSAKTAPVSVLGRRNKHPRMKHLFDRQTMSTTKMEDNNQSEMMIIRQSHRSKFCLSSLGHRQSLNSQSVLSFSSSVNRNNKDLEKRLNRIACNGSENGRKNSTISNFDYSSPTISKEQRRRLLNRIK